MRDYKRRDDIQQCTSRSSRPASRRRSTLSSGRPCWRCAPSTISQPRAAGAVPVRIALEQTDGSVFHFDTGLLPADPSAGGGERHASRALRQVPPVVARRLAHPSRWPGRSRGRARRALSRHGDRPLRLRTSSASGCSTTRSTSFTRATCRRSARHDQAARPSPRRLPHRLRSRRQRSQGRRGHRRPRRLQRRNGVGSVSQAGSAVSLRRHHGLAEEGRRAPAARRRHRRQRRGRLRQQPGQGGLPLPRRRAGRLRRARQRPLPRDQEGLERRPVRGRQRRRGDRARRLDVARQNAILGIALGTSTAAGYVTPDGNITSWLDELAFVPIDYNPDAPVDEWSGDYGVGSQYFSQQAVGRLMPGRRHRARPARTWGCRNG